MQDLGCDGPLLGFRGDSLIFGPSSVYEGAEGDVARMYGDLGTTSEQDIL